MRPTETQCPICKWHLKPKPCGFCNNTGIVYYITMAGYYDMMAAAERFKQDNPL